MKELVSRKLPFAFVNSPLIQSWARVWIAKCVPPSPYMVSNVYLPVIYDAARTTIIMMLKEMSFSSFDTDCWTSPNGKQYISLVVHCTFPNFSVQTMVLESHAFSASHTSANLDHMVTSMCANWEIPAYKMHCTVHDNASNVTQAVIKFSKMDSIPCYIHTNQLLIKDCIMGQRLIQTVVRKSKRLATHMHSSTKSTGRLLKIQDIYGLKKLKIAQDVATRWDSTINMLKSILKMKASINLFFLEHGQDLPRVLKPFSKRHWQTMEKVCDLFNNLQINTKMFSEEECKASEIIPAIYLNLSYLYSGTTTKMMKVIRVTLLAVRAASWQRYEKSYLRNINCIIATFLDPRFKM